jgi:hypothetical protein
VRAGMPHEKVKHSAGEYVRGNVHTNNIEAREELKHADMPKFDRALRALLKVSSGKPKVKKRGK